MRYLFQSVFTTGVVLVVLLFNSSAAVAVDCFQCHTSSDYRKKVNHPPAAKGNCLSCHSPHVARFDGLLQQSVKDLCLTCHTDAGAGSEQGQVHQPIRSGNCLSCHNPHAADYDGLFKERPADTCLGCHQELPQRYANTHTPYIQGNCQACHQPHQSEHPYLLVKAADDLCLTCHHSAQITSKHPDFPAPPANCSSCHHPHGSERKGLIRNQLHAAYVTGCTDCHVGSRPVGADTCFGCHPQVAAEMASSHNHLVRYGANGCIACHSPHAGDDERLLKGKERHVCGNCHAATFVRHDNAAFSHQQTQNCSDCHAAHGSNHPAMMKGPINEVCGDCHGDHATFSHPIGERVFDPRTGQMMTCGSCHATKGTNYEFHTRLNSDRALCVQCHVNY